MVPPIFLDCFSSLFSKFCNNSQPFVEIRFHDYQFELIFLEYLRFKDRVIFEGYISELLGILENSLASKYCGTSVCVHEFV